MAKTPLIGVSISKAEAELKRMLRGEIAFNPGYLSELIEITDENGKDFHLDIDFNLACSVCNNEPVVVPCPECQIAPRDDCSLCNGDGGWLACQVCEDEQNQE